MNAKSETNAGCSGTQLKNLLNATEETLTRAGRLLLEDELSSEGRLAFVACGGALIVVGAMQRTPLACVLGTVGMGIALRGMSNMPLARVLGLGIGRHGMDMKKMSQSPTPMGQQNPSARDDGRDRNRRGSSEFLSQELGAEPPVAVLEIIEAVF